MIFFLDKMIFFGILMICYMGFRLLSERNLYNIYSVKNKYVIKFYGGFKIYFFFIFYDCFD